MSSYAELKSFALTCRTLTRDAKQPTYKSLR
jgi:hypothetical protein